MTAMPTIDSISRDDGGTNIAETNRQGSLDPLEVLLRRTKRTHWWSPPLAFVSVVLTLVCLLFMFLLAQSVLAELLNWGKTAEDRMRYGLGIMTAVEGMPIILLGLTCSVVGWRYGDSRRVSMVCSVIHLTFVGIVLIGALCVLVVTMWSGESAPQMQRKYKEEVSAIWTPRPFPCANTKIYVGDY
jgi:hypothetical protein